MATRFFVFRFNGRHHIIGQSGLHYTFVKSTPTRVEVEADAEHFLRMGTPESNTYLFRETDINGKPIGIFPPIDKTKRQSHFDPKSFPSDQGVLPAAQWKELTEDLADPWLYYHKVRQKLYPGGRRPRGPGL